MKGDFLSLTTRLFLLFSLTASAAAAPFTIVSIPDFLNADIADACDAPGWDGGDNSINAWQTNAITYVMDAVAAENPDFVLIAGDQVQGHWHYDYDNRLIFGPVASLPELQTTIANAAACYYPAWKKWFTDRNLIFHAAVGDHDIGDNDWPVNTDKTRLVPDYKNLFTEYLMKDTGVFRYSNRPFGTPYEGTAYAFEYQNTLFITVDVFKFEDAAVQLDPATGAVKCAVDGGQLLWLQDTINAARTDPNIKHVIIQGHVPVLGPVRIQNSSGMVMPGNQTTEFWQAMMTSGIDLYLCGEVHDMTASNFGGVEQVAHGGLMGYAPNVNYMVMTIDGDIIDLVLKRVNLIYNPDNTKKLWQTDKNRPKEEYYIDTATGYQTVGTLRINKTSGRTVYENRTGRFLWYGTAPQVMVTHPMDEPPASTTIANKGCTQTINDGTVAGPDFVAGKLGGALQFDANQRVTCGQSPVLGRRTVSAWVNTTYSSETITFMTMGLNDAEGRKWDMDIDCTHNGVFELGVQNGRTDAIGSTKVNDGTWHHLVAALPQGGDSLADVLMYVDGAPIAFTVNFDREINTAPSQLIYGHSANSAYFQQYYGKLDDPAIWSYALSPAQIKALWNLANTSALQYNASQADKLFEAFASQQDVKLGDLLWQYQPSAIAGADGDVTPLADGQFSVNLGGGRGFISIYCPSADITADCQVDLEDLSVLAHQWLQTPSVPSADIAPDQPDSAVNLLDFQKLAQYWL